MGIGLHVYVQLMRPQSHIGTQSIKNAAKHLCFVHSKDLHYEDKKDSRP